MYKTINWISLRKLINIFRKEYDVVFYYPQHFNRTNEGTNPFFDPLITICDKFDLSYLIIEEADKNTNKPKNFKVYRFDFWFSLITFFRKLFCLVFNDTSQQPDRFIGRIISYLSLGRFRSRNYITISNSMINVLPGFNKGSKVFDLQHGVLYYKHAGYFTMGGNLRADLRNTDIHFLVYGEGFAKEFYYASDNNLYSIFNRVFVVGDVLNTRLIENVKNGRSFNKLLYSLQFVKESTLELLEYQKTQLIIFLESIHELFKTYNLTLYLKHHPRYNGAIDLDIISQKFPFAEFTNANIDDLEKEIFIHITQMSTAAFEYSKFGIPTFFVYSNEIPEGRTLYIEHFAYPCVYDSLSEMVLTYIRSSNIYYKDANLATAWYNQFYRSFDSDVFIKALNL